MNAKKIEAQENKLDKPLPPLVIAIIPFYTAFIVGLFLFPVAGDWGWLQGWLFTISVALILGVGYYLINKVNPRVLRNRMKVKKEGLTSAIRKSAGSDTFILPLMSIGFFGAMLLPAFGRRLGWPEIPFWASAFGLVVSSAGNALVLASMYQNAHASKILDINQEQKLVDSGLYSRVRHPLYSGAMLMMLGTPIALGYAWGLIPAALAAFSLIWRIQFEEEMLLKGMAGYSDYQQRVKYKLIPGIY